MGGHLNNNNQFNNLPGYGAYGGFPYGAPMGPINGLPIETGPVAQARADEFTRAQAQKRKDSGIGGFVRGIGNGAVNLVKGIFTVPGILMTAGGIALVAATGGAAAIPLAAIGVGFGGIQMARGVASGNAEKMGEGFFALGTSLLGFRFNPKTIQTSSKSYALQGSRPGENPGFIARVRTLFGARDFRHTPAGGGPVEEANLYQVAFEKMKSLIPQSMKKTSNATELAAVPPAKASSQPAATQSPKAATEPETPQPVTDAPQPADPPAGPHTEAKQAAPSVAKESAPALEPEEIFFDASEDAFPLVEPAPSKAHASAPQESPRTAAPRVTTPPAPEHASAPQGSPQTAAPRVTTPPAPEHASAPQPSPQTTSNKATTGPETPEGPLTPERADQSPAHAGSTPEAAESTSGTSTPQPETPPPSAASETTPESPSVRSGSSTPRSEASPSPGTPVETAEQATQTEQLSKPTPVAEQATPTENPAMPPTETGAPPAAADAPFIGIRRYPPSEAPQAGSRQIIRDGQSGPLRERTFDGTQWSNSEPFLHQSADGRWKVYSFEGDTMVNHTFAPTEQAAALQALKQAQSQHPPAPVPNAASTPPQGIAADVPPAIPSEKPPAVSPPATEVPGPQGPAFTGEQPSTSAGPTTPTNPPPNVPVPSAQDAPPALSSSSLRASSNRQILTQYQRVSNESKQHQKQIGKLEQKLNTLDNDIQTASGKQDAASQARLSRAQMEKNELQSQLSATQSQLAERKVQLAKLSVQANQPKGWTVKKFLADDTQLNWKIQATKRKLRNNEPGNPANPALQDQLEALQHQKEAAKAAMQSKLKFKQQQLTQAMQEQDQAALPKSVGKKLKEQREAARQNVKNAKESIQEKRQQLKTGWEDFKSRFSGQKLNSKQQAEWNRMQAEQAPQPTPPAETQPTGTPNTETPPPATSSTTTQPTGTANISPTTETPPGAIAGEGASEASFTSARSELVGDHAPAITPSPTQQTSSIQTSAMGKTAQPAENARTAGGGNAANASRQAGQTPGTARRVTTPALSNEAPPAGKSPAGKAAVSDASPEAKGKETVRFAEQETNGLNRHDSDRSSASRLSDQEADARLEAVIQQVQEGKLNPNELGNHLESISSQMSTQIERGGPLDQRSGPARNAARPAGTGKPTIQSLTALSEHLKSKLGRTDAHVSANYRIEIPAESKTNAYLKRFARPKEGNLTPAEKVQVRKLVQKLNHAEPIERTDLQTLIDLLNKRKMYEQGNNPPQSRWFE